MAEQSKLSIDISSFVKLRENNFIYVDKTAKLQNMIEYGGWYFLARPKGFGKTLTLSTLTAIFNGKAELFEGLAAYEFVKKYAEHPCVVINFDFGSLNTDSLEDFNDSLKNILIDVADNFGINLEDPINDMSIIDIFDYVYKKFGSFVVLIDNYDTPIINCINDNELLFEIYKTLKCIYRIINNRCSYINFVMITGIEKYNAHGVFSTIRYLEDISTYEYYGDILGYTHDELEKNFSGFIDHESSNINSKDLFEQLKSYNDKFCFDGITNVYHPIAIIKSLISCKPEIYISYVCKEKYNGVVYNFINRDDERFLAVKNSKTYVDKSELLIHTNELINTMDKYVCISRPSGFGKTVNINMLAAYYDINYDASKIFSDLKIRKHESFSFFSNAYIVIHINIKDYINNIKDVNNLVKQLKDDITYDLIRRFGNNHRLDGLIWLMKSISGMTGLRFIILIDEYDYIFREFKDNRELQKEYLYFLCYLIKDKSYLALAYITGILPMRDCNICSGIDFDDYSMFFDYKFNEFVGFTEYEVENLCKKYNRDFNEYKKWYDGYEILENSHIYNPEYVIEYINSGELPNYKHIADTSKILKTYVNIKKYDGTIRDIIINILADDTFTVCQYSFGLICLNSYEGTLALLVHLGYLSYNHHTYTLKIPNKEIFTAFLDAINDGCPHVVQAIKNSPKLLKAVFDFDCQTVAKCIEDVHLETSLLKYDDRDTLAYTISIAFYAAKEKYTIIRECHIGRGFADLVFLPKVGYSDPIIFIELKWDQSVNTALNQIYDRTYPDSLKNLKEKIFIVVINYDKITREHTCSIETFQL